MRLTPEDQERMAQAYLKSAEDKRLSVEMRLKARGEAKRWRALAKWNRQLRAQKPEQAPPGKLRPANEP